MPPVVSLPAYVAIDDDGQDEIPDEALLSMPLPDGAAAATVSQRNSAWATWWGRLNEPAHEPADELSQVIVKE